MSEQRLRILIAEDYVDTAEMLRMILERWDNEVHCAFDGQAAVDMALKLDPDVVLLDIGLPKLDGYEVARRIRASKPGDRPYLVALTGYGTDEEVRRARETGFNHHLRKPVDPIDLKALLKTLRASIAGPTAG